MYVPLYSLMAEYIVLYVYTLHCTVEWLHLSYTYVCNMNTYYNIRSGSKQLWKNGKWFSIPTRKRAENLPDVSTRMLWSSSE